MKREKFFIKSMVTAVLFVILAVSFQTSLAHALEKSLDQTLKLIKQAEKIVKGKILKVELKDANKAVKVAINNLKKGKKENSIKQMKIAVKKLLNIIDYRGEAEGKFKDKINGALASLYDAIGKALGNSITAESSYGLHTATFSTTQGKINVNFPRDMAAGEKITGTIYLSPSGSTEEKKAMNLKALNNYVVEIKEIKDRQTPASQKWNSWTIPPDINNIHLIFKDKDGIELGRAQLPIYREPPFSRATEFQIPTIGQAGNLIRILGPFDSDFSNSGVRFGDIDGEILAESPRGLITLTPDEIIGRTKITLKEGENEIEGDFRNMNVTLKAPKLKLKSGESTTLTTTVEGLKGLSDVISLRIENKTPGVIDMEKSKRKIIFIYPNDVNPEGIYTYKTTITGILPGFFNISARIVLQYDDILIQSGLDINMNQVLKSARKFLDLCSNGADLRIYYQDRNSKAFFEKAVHNVDAHQLKTLINQIPEGSPSVVELDEIPEPDTTEIGCRSKKYWEITEGHVRGY